jgi:molecular chaperone DnaK (HSP70)
MNLQSKTYGIVVSTQADTEDEKNHVHVIIPKHVRIPHSGAHQIYLTQSDQRSLEIKLMEQADSNVEPSEKRVDYFSIGRGVIDGLPPNLPACTPVHIRFNLYEDGILSVVIICSGKECHITANISGVMSDKELEDAKNNLNGFTIA